MVLGPFQKPRFRCVQKARPIERTNTFYIYSQILGVFIPRLDTGKGRGYGPPVFKGASGGVLPAREHVAAMASDEADRAGKSGKDNPSEAELSERRRRLDERLSTIKAEEDAETAKARKQEGDPSAIAKAMRLSSEFVAGIVAGALLGWLVDKFAGTSPWGLIIFLMLGFVAGVRNLMRSANMLGKTSGDQK